MRLRRCSGTVIVVLGSAFVGGFFTVAANATSVSRSQDPRTWRVDGMIREERIPHRVAMSADTPSGMVYFDPHLYYPELGAAIAGTVPVYSSSDGATQVGTLDLGTGFVTLKGRPVDQQRTKISPPGTEDEAAGSTAGGGLP